MSETSYLTKEDYSEIIKSKEGNYILLVFLTPIIFIMGMILFVMSLSEKNNE